MGISVSEYETEIVESTNYESRIISLCGAALSAAVRKRVNRVHDTKSKEKEIIMSEKENDKVEETPQPDRTEEILGALKALGSQIEGMQEWQKAVDVELAKPVNDNIGTAAAFDAPTVLKHGKDTFGNALKAWVRSGDGGGLGIGREKEYEMPGFSKIAEGRSDVRKGLKASNPTDMNIGTADDMLNMIVARRDDADLTAKLRCCLSLALGQ